MIAGPTKNHLARSPLLLDRVVFGGGNSLAILSGSVDSDIVTRFRPYMDSVGMARAGPQGPARQRSSPGYSNPNERLYDSSCRSRPNRSVMSLKSDSVAASASSGDDCPVIASERCVSRASQYSKVPGM